MPAVDNLIRPCFLRALIVVLVALPAWAQDPEYCARPEYTTGLFTCAGVTCPPEGQGGDPILNRLKNRDVLPDELGSEPIGIVEMVQWHRSDNPPLVWTDRARLRRLRREFWLGEALEEVQDWECQPAVVEGYLTQRNVESVESCNCGTSRQPCVDFHVFVSAPEYLDDDGRCVSSECRGKRLVVEVTPRLIDQHPEWTSALMQRLAACVAHVRITGWRMWDPEHPDQVDLTRGTLWEIHPIHRIEVELPDGTWVDVDDGWSCPTG